MTREDAIEILRLIRLGKHITNDEALEMAIKALEQKPCDDKRLFIKIYADYEPSVVAEKVYQICDEDELPEVVSRLNAYLEPCDDAVSRQAIIDLIEQAVGDKNVAIGDFTFGKSLMLHHIEQLPSVQPKRQTGKWIEHEIKDTCRWLTCSVCGYEWINKKENFCPNCGCRMVEPQESEE